MRDLFPLQLMNQLTERSTTAFGVSAQADGLAIDVLEDVFTDGHTLCLLLPVYV